MCVRQTDITWKRNRTSVVEENRFSQRPREQHIFLNSQNLLRNVINYYDNTFGVHRAYSNIPL